MPALPTRFSLADPSNLTAKISLWAAISLAILLVKFGFHEMWKDEWQAWLMARDMGWGELTASLYYEGHPALWYSYLKIWTGISGILNLAEDVALQLAHTLVIIAALGVFIVKFRLPLWVKILLLLGYFFFFEYGIVNRGYALVMLLAFSVAASLEAVDRKPFKLAALLFLLCQTEVFGVLMGGAFFFYLLLEKGFFKTPIEVIKQATVLKLGAGLLLGILVFVLSVFPRGEKEALSQAYTSAPFSAANLGEAFQGQLANTYLIGLIPDTNVFGVTALGIGLSFIVLFAISYLFWQEKKVLLTWLLFTLVYFLFGAGIYPGGVRQWGMGFLFFVICLQLWAFKKPQINPAKMAILLAIIAFQAYYNGLALSKEFQFPFSQAKSAAQFIQQNVPENVPIVAINKFAAAPVIGYAGRKFYEMPEGVEFSYFKWLQKIYLPTEAELRLFAKFKNVGGIIIISDKQLPSQRYPTVQLWESFDGFNLKNENYYLYALKR